MSSRAELEERCAQLEDALSEFARAVDMLTFEVEGDMRREYLQALAQVLAALPRHKWPPSVRGVA